MADPRIYLNTQPIQPLGNHKGKLQCSGQSRETASFSDLLREAGRQVVFPGMHRSGCSSGGFQSART